MLGKLRNSYINMTVYDIDEHGNGRLSNPTLLLSAYAPLSARSLLQGSLPLRFQAPFPCFCFTIAHFQTIQFQSYPTIP